MTRKKNQDELTLAQKKEWAKTLYLKENMTTFKTLAERVGVGAHTISKWVEAGNWEKLRQNTLLTRQEQLCKLLAQLEEFNNYIEAKPEGLRFADSKEADARRKLIADIKALETEASIAETVSVCSNIVEWTAKLNLDNAKQIIDLFDDYIKYLLK
jgi:transposase